MERELGLRTVFFAACSGRDGGHTVNDDAPEFAEWADYQG
jgi:hypothetical protein